jgi:monoamine oxidase
VPGTGDPIQRALRRRAAELRGEWTADEAGVGTTRRAFLGRTAGAGLAAWAAWPALASAAPRRAHQARHRARVVIVGAGLAGLTCAYRLRQHGVHADVFEARTDRVGGRCWTVRIFEHGQVSEHGGEFIDTRHVHTLAIVKELGLTLEDREAHSAPSDAVRPLWLNGRLRDPAKVYAGFDRMYRRLVKDYKRIGNYRYDRASEAARTFDEMTVLEWLDQHVDDPLLREAIDIGQSGFYGVDSANMSAINLLEAYVAPYPGADERYHTHGGNDLIPKGMAATLDDGAIHLDSPLRAMWRRSDGTYALRFGGIARPVLADRVVLSLPFTALRDVELAGAGFSEKRLEAIQQLGMGTNAKNHVQLRTRPYRIGKWSGGMTMDAPFRQSSWDSTEGQSGPTGVITIWRGGRSGASYPTGIPHQRTPEPIVDANLAAFERGVPGITDAFNGHSWLDAWVNDPWVRGSYAGFLPGQYTRYWGYLGRREGAVHFAGEHTSTYSQGYLNGGVESGDRAAREVLGAIS